MPSTYTHYRFGKDVFDQLKSKEIKRIIRENHDLYLMGLHGPDIFFYYGALGSNKVNAVGYGLHEKNAKYFFTNAKETLKSSAKKEAGLAYILGYVCHFALDSECHSYIEYVINTTELRHTEIETDFERYLLRQDGINPMYYNTAIHIRPGKYAAHIIAKFYDTLSDREVYRSLRQMKMCNQLLLPTNAVKRYLVKQVLTITGNYTEMHGLLISSEADKRCRRSTGELEQRYDRAIPQAVSLIQNFCQYLEGKDALCSRFNRTFGPDRQEMKMLEEELLHV